MSISMRMSGAGMPKYLLAFKAPPNVVVAIVKQQELKRESNQGYDSDSERFPWWSSEFRRQAEFYQFEDERREILRQLWHDPATGRCHFGLVYWWKFQMAPGMVNWLCCYPR